MSVYSLYRLNKDNIFLKFYSLTMYVFYVQCICL